MVHSHLHATHLRGTPHYPTPRPIQELLEKAALTAQQQGFRVHVFQTSELSVKRVVQTINAAMKNNWEHKDIVRECARQKLSLEEKAFVLNFPIYYKELAKQPEFRESVKQQVDYLFKEPVERFRETGKASYGISLLGPDGSPAGMLLGALLQPHDLLTHNKTPISPTGGSGLINFYQYIVVPEGFREKGAADVLRAQAEQFVKDNTRHNSDIMIAQVDKDNPVYDDEVKLKMLSYEIPGLRHFEIIPEKNQIYGRQKVFPTPGRQDSLTLRVALPTEQGFLHASFVEDMVKAYVSYYDVYPKHTIAGTERKAFDSYVAYHLKNVKFDNDGNVKLEYRP